MMAETMMTSVGGVMLQTNAEETMMMITSSTKIDERNNAMEGKGAPLDIHLRFVPPPGGCHRDD